MSHSVGRLLWEISQDGGLPAHVWAAAMMYFHAFQEYTLDSEKIDSTMVGITCLALSVKANENYLKSQGSIVNPVHRLLGLLDSAARLVLSYSTNSASTEKIVDTKKRLKELIPTVELAVMRVVGNSLVVETAFTETGLSESELNILTEIYSSPACLNFPRDRIIDFVTARRDCPQLRSAIEPFFI
jgi:hypothetical protein